MILSCIERVRKKLGYYVGPSLLAQVLRGSKNKRVLELQLDSVASQLSGSLSEINRMGFYVYAHQELRDELARALRTSPSREPSESGLPSPSAS